MPHRNTSHPAQNLGPGDLIKFRPHRPNEPRVVRTQRSPHPLEKILRSPHGMVRYYLMAVSTKFKTKAPAAAFRVKHSGSSMGL
jgi:hypothetical protein